MVPSLVRGPWRGSTGQRAFGTATVSSGARVPVDFFRPRRVRTNRPSSR